MADFKQGNDNKLNSRPAESNNNNNPSSASNNDHVKRQQDIQSCIHVFCEGAWDRVIYYGLDPFVQEEAAHPSFQPEVDKPVVPFRDFIAALDATLPKSADLVTLVTKSRLIAQSGDNNGYYGLIVECLEALLEILSPMATPENMLCTCTQNNNHTNNKQKVFIPSGSFGMSGNIGGANNIRPTCKILIAQALLYLEAPDVFFSLLINWPDDGVNLRSLGFEWILKILGIFDLLFLRNALFLCEVATSRGLCSKKAWWHGGVAFAKSLALLENPPLGAFVACTEVISSAVQTSKDRHNSYQPLRQLSRFRNPQFFGSTCRAIQRAAFPILKPFLEHLIQSFSRMENVLSLLGDPLWPSYFAPLLLVGGAHAWPNLRFHRENAKEAQGEVETVIKLTISICVSLLHAGFIGYKEGEDSGGGGGGAPKSPKSLVRGTSSRNLVEDSSPKAARRKNLSFDLGKSSEQNVTRAAETHPFARLLLSLLHAIENIAMWTNETVLLTRALLLSLIFKLMPSINTFRQDPTSLAWSHAFQLSVVIENFVFYSPVMTTPIRTMNDRSFTHPGTHAGDDASLARGMVELLSSLKVKSLSSDMFEDVEGKVQCKHVTKRTLEELHFWTVASDFLVIAADAETKKVPLAKTKEYRLCETHLRLRRTKYRQTKSNSIHDDNTPPRRASTHHVAPSVPQLETKQFDVLELKSKSAKPFDSKQAEKFFWSKKKEVLVKDKSTKEHRQRVREKIEAERKSIDDEKRVEGWWAKHQATTSTSTKTRSLFSKLTALTSRSLTPETVQQAQEVAQLRGEFPKPPISDSSSSTTTTFRSHQLLPTPAAQTATPLPPPSTVNVLAIVPTDFKDELCSKVDSDDEEDPLLWAECRPRSLDDSLPLPPPPRLAAEHSSSLPLPMSDLEPRKSEMEVTCAKCSKGSIEGFHSVNNQPYCTACWQETLLCALCHETFPKDELYVRASFPDGIGSAVLVEQMFHQKCFVCTEDKEALPQAVDGSYPDVRFCEKQLFCLTHYNAKYGVQCAHCTKVIEKTVIYCLERAWHPGHLFCANACGNQLNEQDLNIPSTKEWSRMALRKHPLTSSSLRTQVGFCQPCYERDVQDACKGCGKLFQIDEEAALVADKDRFVCFHFSCVRCVVCTSQTKEQMSGVGAILSPEGVLFCAAHFKAQQKGSLPSFCSRCHSPISGSIVNANNSHYHPQCLRCSACSVLLDPDLFVGGQNIPLLCAAHAANSSSGSACASCFEPLDSGTIFELEGFRYHDDCLVCFTCKTRLGNAEDKQVRMSPPTAAEHLQNRFWCASHFATEFSTKCVTCGEGILDKVIVFRDLPRHQKCIHCHVCKTPLTSQTIAEHNGLLFCFAHFQLTHQPVATLSLSLSLPNIGELPRRLSPDLLTESPRRPPPTRPPPPSPRLSLPTSVIPAPSESKASFRKPAALPNVYFAPLDPSILTPLQLSISPCEQPNLVLDTLPNAARSAAPPKRAPPTRPPPRTPS